MIPIREPGDEVQQRSLVPFHQGLECLVITSAGRLDQFKIRVIHGHRSLITLEWVSPRDQIFIHPLLNALSKITPTRKAAPIFHMAKAATMSIT